MIKHIVMWRIKDGENKDEVISNMKEQLEALTAEIPFLRSITVGKNAVCGDNACDVALVSEFDSLEDLNAYVNHPAHVRVGSNYVKPYVSERRSCDFEF